MTLRCDRCKKKTNITKMSMFNTDILCPDCISREIRHPAYAAAREAERAAVLAGNYNFTGVGLPDDLK